MVEYISILAGLDIIIIVFYLVYIGIVEEIGSFHETIAGALLGIFCGIRAFWGVYMILKESYVETNNESLESALDGIFYFELGFDLILIPLVVFFFLKGVFNLDI